MSKEELGNAMDSLLAEPSTPIQATPQQLVPQPEMQGTAQQQTTPVAIQNYETSVPIQDINLAKKQRTVRTLGIVVLVLGSVVGLAFLAMDLYMKTASLGDMGWAVGFLAANALMFLMLIICPIVIILSIITIVLGVKRKVKKLFPYVAITLGILLSFSPFIYSSINTSIRTTQRENQLMTDPFAFTGGMGFFDIPTPCRWRSVSIDYVATDIICEIHNFYVENGRLPMNDDVDELMKMIDSEYFRADGQFTISIGRENTPNEREFSVHYNTSCRGSGGDPHSVLVLTPLYTRNNDPFREAAGLFSESEFPDGFLDETQRMCVYFGRDITNIND
ncbi:hypothetical protein FWH09_03240 [Candidatus Saccharibacteria bacterium]|nr:hypothetical protein [Candidatus Saccharibacteria bacterium]